MVRSSNWGASPTKSSTCSRNRARKTCRSSKFHFLKDVVLPSAPLSSIFLTLVPVPSVSFPFVPMPSVPVLSMPVPSIPVPSIPVPSIPIPSISGPSKITAPSMSGAAGSCGPSFRPAPAAFFHFRRVPWKRLLLRGHRPCTKRAGPRDSSASAFP